MTMSFAEYQPLGMTLKKHQRETITHILRHKRCSVLDGIGTGKTVSSLSASDFLMHHGKISKVLVISPLSVIISTWAEHIIHHYPHRTFTLLIGPKSERKARLNLDKNFYIINTDGIKVIKDEIIKKKFDMIVIDESTTFSYHKSQRTKDMWKIAQSAKSVVIMTGDPIPNDTIQSFGQAKLIDYNRIPYFTRFRDQLKYKLDMYNYIDKENAIDLAYAVLQPSIRHKLEDCTDMPPMLFQFRDIKLTKEQEKHYALMEKEYITWIEDETVTAANAAVRAIKLMQISCGLIIDNEGNAIDVDHKNRIKELEEVFGQTDKLVVFANFTKSINSLIEKFPIAAKIDGSVNVNKRADIIDQFQNGDLKMIVAHPKAVSHGVTLHAANTIVWWSPCLSNEQFNQCNGRIRRIGQNRPQLIIRFRSTKIENRIYSALRRKRKTSEALLQMAEQDT